MQGTAGGEAVPQKKPKRAPSADPGPSVHKAVGDGVQETAGGEAVPKKKSKRAPPADSGPSITSSTKQKPARSSALSWYKKSYHGGGAGDFHFAILRAAAELTASKKVFYPGSYCHVTASLVFPDVLYVDCDAKVAPALRDAAVSAYIVENKLYDDTPVLRFKLGSYEKLAKGVENVDLLISMSAGLVSTVCSGSVKPGGGFLLVSDAHSDARTAFLDPKWELFGAWDTRAARFDTRKVTLDRCFVCAKTREKLSRAQVAESVRVGAVRARSFRLLHEPMFFLFRRKK